MFQTIGKYWAKGHLPYVSLWDSKGSIIFFINAIGYFLTDLNLGVFFLQIICLIGSVFGIKETLNKYYNAIFVGETRIYKEAEQEIMSMIPECELDSFIAYNTNPGIYLQLDIKPYYRFFTTQDWAASRSQTLEKLLVNTFAEGDVKWVFVEGSPDETLIREVLEDRYMCVANRKKPFVNTMYYLFQLKE